MTDNPIDQLLGEMASSLEQKGADPDKITQNLALWDEIMRREFPEDSAVEKRIKEIKLRKIDREEVGVEFLIYVDGGAPNTIERIYMALSETPEMGMSIETRFHLFEVFDEELGELLQGSFLQTIPYDEFRGKTPLADVKRHYQEQERHRHENYQLAQKQKKPSKGRFDFWKK